MNLHEAIKQFEELNTRAEEDLTPVQHGIFLGIILKTVDAEIFDGEEKEEIIYG